MAAGYRSPMPVLGISAVPSATQAGLTSLLALWFGGRAGSAADAPAAVTAPYRIVWRVRRR